MGMFNWLFGSKSKQPEVQAKVPNNSSYSPLQKYYAFNETGNVMVCTTREGTNAVNENLKSMFLDMSIFFAAMTKAIVTHKYEDGFAGSIYSSDALQKILNQSEYFVEVKAETIKASSMAVGHSMSKELTECLLGRRFEETRLNFSHALFHSMSNQYSVVENAKGEKASRKQVEHEKPKLDGINNSTGAGTIFFICESILGLPMVSAVVLELESIDGRGKKSGEYLKGNEEKKEISKLLDMKEESKSKGIEREWIFKKHTYLFISPKSISGVNFPDPGDDIEYQTLLASLKECLIPSNNEDVHAN